MSTEIRAELSKKNPYWIEKHRYYELKHFCRQYSIWKQAYDSLGGLASKSFDLGTYKSKYRTSNPTERIAMARNKLKMKMDMIDKAAEESDSTLAEYLIIGVTNGLGYDALSMKYALPCCRDTYYASYRRFFWLLNKTRD